MVPVIHLIHFIQKNKQNIVHTTTTNFQCNSTKEITNNNDNNKKKNKLKNKNKNKKKKIKNKK